MAPLECPKCGKEIYIGRHKDVRFFPTNSRHEEVEIFVTLYIEYCNECSYTHIYK